MRLLSFADGVRPTVYALLAPALLLVPHPGRSSASSGRATATFDVDRGLVRLLHARGDDVYGRARVRLPGHDAGRRGGQRRVRWQSRCLKDRSPHDRGRRLSRVRRRHYRLRQQRRAPVRLGTVERLWLPGRHRVGDHRPVGQRRLRHAGGAGRRERLHRHVQHH